MITSACLAFVFAAVPAQVRLEETPTTRVFVRTVPSRAKIVLDGKTLGESDGLFIVPPGVRRITVELDGFRPEVHELNIPEGRITRFEWNLRKHQPADGAESLGAGLPTSPKPPTSPDANRGSRAASTFISQADIPADVQTAIQTVLRQHPSETRWSGRAGSSLFAVAAKRLPEGEVRRRSGPAILELVHVQAIHELLTAKSLLDRFEAVGLDDATTLRQAVEEAAGAFHVTGNVKGVVHQTAAVDDFVVGYVVAQETALGAYLSQSAKLEIVRAAYRDVMHRQARELMEHGDWQNALLLWQHLHKRKLVSQQLYLDAARCFEELKQTEDTVRVLAEALAAFGEAGPPEFFEQAGDLLLEIQTDEAQSLAETAYQKASEALKETISGSN